MRMTRSPSWISASGIDAPGAAPPGCDLFPLAVTLAGCPPAVAVGVLFSGGMARRLLAGNAAEHCADGHSDARQISSSQNVARHDFAGSKDILRRPVVL